VEENLLLGAFRPKARAAMKSNLAFMLRMLPRLAERRSQLAGSMSGGEQQMLALARALMLAPRILLIDEPSVGLAPCWSAAPSRRSRSSRTVPADRADGRAELRAGAAHRRRGYVIVHGQIAFEGRSADELNNNELIRKFYLGL